MGGRVPWPEALERGHAVFVLLGKAQWLLIKRRDDHARLGSDVVAERPRSVISGSTLDELLRKGSAE